MKNKILFIIIGVFILNSCSEDYLNTMPTASTTTALIFETTDKATLAINGLNKLMTRQYLKSQGFNGEGTIKMYYGNYPGNHLYINRTSRESIINSENLTRTTSKYTYYPWFYYYNIISNANTIIAEVDAAEGSENDKEFIKAQALTYRAYSYFMLSQLYCKRWIDSNNGESNGLVLRLDQSSGDQPLSTLKEVYEQIYSDLDNAITLYQSSGKTRNYNYEPDINVAYAIYARSAITRQDYGTAATMAVDARQGYPLMSNTNYKSGFYFPNQEWIWSSYGSDDETLYYYSYFAYIAYNSNASAVRNYPKCISKELYEKIPSTDIRRDLFLDPGGYSYSSTSGQAGSSLTSYARDLFPDIYSSSRVYAWMQFKIKAEELPGVGHLNHFRSSEMFLIEAEARYFLQEEEKARQALEILNKESGRNPSYASSNTGTNLLEEIKTYRAIELWGEGFNWFDLKRWGDGINRKGFDDGGNFASTFAVSYGATDKNNWVWLIPARETEYNNEILE